jgi:YaiO family outer membrane protein
MKRVLFAVVILCFTQQFANAQAENNGATKGKVPEIKESTLKINFGEQLTQMVADQRKKEFSDYLNQKPQFTKFSNDSKEEVNSDLEDDSNVDADEEESEKAAEKVKHKYEVQFNYSTEALTGNYGIWRIASLYFQRRSADKKIIWGQYRVSERRSFGDREFIAGIYQPLGKKWAFTAEGMYSPTKNFVGGFSTMGEVERIFKGGWVGHLGVRHTSYTSVKATTSYALVEKYWGNNRLANTLYVTNLSNAGTAPSYRLQYNRYYGEKVNTFGAAVSFGREHENIGPPIGIFRANTWSLSGSFKHWITDNFGISADVVMHRQGDLYYRRGLNFGARYRF